MFEMATGRPAFSGKTLPAVFGAILNHEPKPVSRHNPEVPPALDRIISRALQKSSIGRYPSAKDLLHDLERLVASSKSRRTSASLAVLAL
jgi:serine/threonine-protein kinase